MADLQRGFVVREQLIAAGLGRGAISHRLATGRLHEYYRGVYLVGRPSVAPLGAETAAVLAFRGHGILSHLTAAWMWGLLEQRPEAVAITVVGRSGHSRPGLMVHRRASFDRRDLRRRHGLPLASPAVTILDVALTLSDLQLEHVIAEAAVRGLAHERELRTLIAGSPRKHGVARLRAAVEVDYQPALTRSEAERKMLSLLRAAQLPAPVVNARLLGMEVDFLWPQARLVLEIDGRAFHAHRRAFETDRKRDQRLVAAGYRVIRVTWAQLRDEPYAVIARIAQALAVAG